jgi:3-isopropylmalate/(R)-2-methylmalate dehydratase small subunit
MQPFTRETGIAAPLEGRNIDTDQIVPARFLKVDRSKGYGRIFFHDRRFDEQGNELGDFVLNEEPFRQATILVTDVNFGCGSSREAAVYALADFGIRAVISPSFGDIFYNNCLKNGIVPVCLDEAVVNDLRGRLREGDDHRVTVDLEQLTVRLPGGGEHKFTIDSFWRDCLLKGVDDLELTLSHEEDIQKFEADYYAEMPWARVPNVV